MRVHARPGRNMPHAVLLHRGLFNSSPSRVLRTSSACRREALARQASVSFQPVNV